MLTDAARGQVSSGAVKRRDNAGPVTSSEPFEGRNEKREGQEGSTSDKLRERGLHRKHVASLLAALVLALVFLIPIGPRPLSLAGKSYEGQIGTVDEGASDGRNKASEGPMDRWRRGTGPDRDYSTGGEDTSWMRSRSIPNPIPFHVSADGRGQCPEQLSGDVMVRGPQSLPLLHIIGMLKSEAAKAGGKVVALLGNHEVMNLRGQLGYVHPDELAQYGKATWARDFRPDGMAGRHVAHFPAAAVEGEGPCRTLFVHAGLTPAMASNGVEALNREVAGALEDEDFSSPTFGDTGPFWYRGYALEPETKICPMVEAVLSQVKAARMVIGHSPQAEGITSRCGGLLTIIDVGISSAYHGRQAAWECGPMGVARALYPGRGIVL